MQFKDFLAEKFRDRLVIVQDTLVPARIAIILPENQERVKEQLSGSFLSSPDRPPIETNRLPFSLVAAFCLSPDLSSRVYYRILPPSRYVMGTVAPDETNTED